MFKETKIGKANDFCFEYGHLLGAKKVSLKTLEELVPRMEQADANVKTIHATGNAINHLSKNGAPEKVYFTRQGFIEEGYPNKPATIKQLEKFSEEIKEYDVAICIGIGGSYLGNKVIFDVFAGPFWNEKTKEERKGYPRMYFSGNNLDSTEIGEIWEHLEFLAEQQGKLNVKVIPISKSGTTIESTVTFMYFYDKLMSAQDRFSTSVSVVTECDEANSAFYRLAKKHDWEVFEMPEGVGGRFSVLTTPGLITGCALGINIKEFLKGASEMATLCLESPIDKNPALMNAALKYLAAVEQNADVEVFMGYGAALKAVGEWYVQLLAESLGKRFDREGKTVYYGRTPVAAVGTTDMHAQTQQHQDGKRDKVIQFLEIAKVKNDIKTAKIFLEETSYEKYHGKSFDKLLKVALDANEAALTSDDRLSGRYILPELNERYLGQLFTFLMFSIAYEGELANVNAYDQPGVEVYKKIMQEKIAEDK